MTPALAGRVVVITGASRGIGLVLAEAFARGGASLGLMARDAVALKEVAGRLPAPALPVPCDVSNEDAVRDGFREVAEKFGGVDSLVANAGISPAAHRGHNLSPEVWREVVEVNLTGSFLTAAAAYPYLAESGRGRIVFTSSVMARAPRRGLSAYAASKAGIAGLTRALAVDWAGDGICVNAVAPGFFETGLGAAFREAERLEAQVLARTPLGRFGKDREIADTVGFLAGDASSYLTGHVLAVDGGYGLG
jgi:NAD(P)-dependent dehydrogenase (short-subunit alcohol dehydrogenase family)